MAGRGLAGATCHILAFVRERPRSLDELVEETGIARVKLTTRLSTMVARGMLRRLRRLRRRSGKTKRKGQSVYVLGTNVPATMLSALLGGRTRVAGGRTGHFPVWPAPAVKPRLVRFDRCSPKAA